MVLGMVMSSNLRGIRLLTKCDVAQHRDICDLGAEIPFRGCVFFRPVHFAKLPKNAHYLYYITESILSTCQSLSSLKLAHSRAPASSEKCDYRRSIFSMHHLTSVPGQTTLREWAAAFTTLQIIDEFGGGHRSPRFSWGLPQTPTFSMDRFQWSVTFQRNSVSASRMNELSPRDANPFRRFIPQVTSGPGRLNCTFETI
jgi:hypothetical protein